MHSGRACWVTFMSCFHLCVLAYACVAIYVATCSQVGGGWMGRGVCLLLRSSVAWTPDQPSVPPASPCQCRCSMCLVPVFVMPVSCASVGVCIPGSGPGAGQDRSSMSHRGQVATRLTVCSSVAPPCPNVHHPPLCRTHRPTAPLQYTGQDGSTKGSIVIISCPRKATKSGIHCHVSCLIRGRQIGLSRRPGCCLL